MTIAPRASRALCASFVLAATTYGCGAAETRVQSTPAATTPSVGDRTRTDDDAAPQAPAREEPGDTTPSPGATTRTAAQTSEPALVQSPERDVPTSAQPDASFRIALEVGTEPMTWEAFGAVVVASPSQAREAGVRVPAGFDFTRHVLFVPLPSTGSLGVVESYRFRSLTALESDASQSEVHAWFVDEPPCRGIELDDEVPAATAPPAPRAQSVRVRGHDTRAWVLPRPSVSLALSFPHAHGAPCP